MGAGCSAVAVEYDGSVRPVCAIKAYAVQCWQDANYEVEEQLCKSLSDERIV